ncbi:MAG TPA: hypothetical protein H9975_03285 [Candidatus Alistipes avistercoris]|nr:hypothetical protein [Candidatus Alistipes avistercoris]
MGSVIYNFLADSLFFNENNLENDFANESEERIQQELQNYRNHCIKNYGELIKEIVERDSFLKVFSSSEETSLGLLKQTALYVDQFIIQDPLFKLTEMTSEISNVTAQYLGYNNSGYIDRKALKQAALFLKDITPMVAVDYVKIFPLSYYFEAPKQTPIYLPEDYYNKILSEKILNFFRENVSVWSMEKVETEGWKINEKELYPCRSIMVGFKGDPNFRLIYHLFKTQFLKYDQKTGLIEFNLPKTPPEINSFKAWVTQSINSASKTFYDKVFGENIIAANLNSTYLCDNNFTYNLITRNFGNKQTIQTETATNIINFDLPFLDNINTQKLMMVREYDADVFTNFRLELERNFRELRILDDPVLIKQKTENIFHELYDVQLQKIKQKIEHLHKQVFVNSLIALGGLAGGFATGGFSLLATAIALGKGYKDYNDYKENVKENPSYLLWLVKNK